MATLLLTVGASSLATSAGLGPFAALDIKATAVLAGSVIDSKLFGGPGQHIEGPRLDNLQVQASIEGAPIPEIAGRVRLAGQIIWATKFREVAMTEEVGGGKGGGGGTVTQTTYSYFALFAVLPSRSAVGRSQRRLRRGRPLRAALQLGATAAPISMRSPEPPRSTTAAICRRTSRAASSTTGSTPWLRKRR